MNGWTEDQLQRLASLRGWTPEAIERLELHPDKRRSRKGRVVFTIRDESGADVGRTSYQPDPEQRERAPKLIADKDTTRELFPPPETIGDEELDGTIWLVEGEPDAVRLWALGLPAVGVPGAQNWRAEWASRFAGRRLRVIVCFDCDETGRTNAIHAAGDLTAAGVETRIVDLDPGRNSGFDVSDLTGQDVGEDRRAQIAESLRALARTAETFAPPTIALAELLARAEAFCRRFLVTLSDAHFCVLALWIAHTYAIDAAETTPYLHVTSAESSSGKTRVLEVLDVLVYKPAPLVDPSAASLYRGLDSGEIVTLLIDEVDTFIGGGADSETKRTVLGIINGGYRRGLRVSRVPDGRTLYFYELFGPKALTGIGALPQTLESRSLRYRMRRRRRDTEPIEKFRRKHALQDARPIAEEFSAWAADSNGIAQLERADPELPDALDDRQQDSCELLVAIADLAGGDWPERARRGLVAIVEEARAAESAESRGTILLADLRDAFERLGERVVTSALLTYVNALDERPWGSWHEGEGLSARDLARLLRPFEVRPTTVRASDGSRGKGYKREDCEDAFARYLDGPAVTSVTTAQPSDLSLFSIRDTGTLCHGSEQAANPHGSTGVTDVTDQEQGERAGGRFCDVCATPNLCSATRRCREIERRAAASGREESR